MDEDQTFFWKKIEKGMEYPIPTYIKNGFSMCGLAHPVSFQKVTDLEISLVENFIRTKTLGFLIKNLCDSIDKNCDALVDDDELKQYFGALFVKNTTGFEFSFGDKLLIKEIVNHVQLKSNKHGNSYFKNPTKKKIDAAQNNNGTATMEIDKNQLTLQLEQKVIRYFRRYVVDFDTDLIDVGLRVEDGKTIYGDVHCVICKIEKRKKQKPKGVYFNTNGKGKGVWVLSNLDKHMKQIHSTNAPSKSTKNVKTPRKRKVPKKKPTQTVEMSQTTPIDISTLGCSIEIHDAIDADEPENEDKENASVIMTNDDDLRRVEKQRHDNPDDLFTQLSSQVTKVQEGVLTKSEAQENINFVLNKSPRKLTITHIQGDGNCMFGSLAHQLWLHKIDSNEHMEATKRLRADVVEHILDPKNFPRFEHELRDRIFLRKQQTNQLSEITNVAAECKLFVRHALSKNGIWGGTETLLAVSDLYSTNIVVFKEDEKCYKTKQTGQNYERSIAIAHRIGLDEQGQKIFNHYDSVCDISSDDIYSVARYIANK